MYQNRFEYVYNNTPVPRVSSTAKDSESKVLGTYDCGTKTILFLSLAPQRKSFPAPAPSDLLLMTYVFW